MNTLAVVSETVGLCDEYRKRWPNPNHPTDTLRDQINERGRELKGWLDRQQLIEVDPIDGAPQPDFVEAIISPLNNLIGGVARFDPEYPAIKSRGGRVNAAESLHAIWSGVHHTLLHDPNTLAVAHPSKLRFQGGVVVPISEIHAGERIYAIGTYHEIDVRRHQTTGQLQSLLLNEQGDVVYSLDGHFWACR